MSAHALPDSCPNCGAEVHGPFCAQCGQETIIETPSVFEFVHEYVHHFVAAEGKIWRTLWLLLVKPGSLTLEYINGRRKRYVRPLPLYLTLSFVFFLALSFYTTHSALEHLEVKAPSKASANAGTPKNTPALPDARALDSKDAREALEKARANEKHDNPNDVLSEIKHADDDPDEPEIVKTAVNSIETSQTDLKYRHELIREFLHKMPWAIFAMLPVFAFWCWLFRFRRRRPFGEFALYSLHFHAFVLLAGLIWMALHHYAGTNPGWLFFVSWIYLGVSMKRVFGGGWVRDAVRSLGLMSLHIVAVSVALLGALVLAAST